MVINVYHDESKLIGNKMSKSKLLTPVISVFLASYIQAQSIVKFSVKPEAMYVFNGSNEMAIY